MIFIPIRYINIEFIVLIEGVCRIGITPDTVKEIRRFPWRLYISVVCFAFCYFFVSLLKIRPSGVDVFKRFPCFTFCYFFVSFLKTRLSDVNIFKRSLNLIFRYVITRTYICNQQGR